MLSTAMLVLHLSLALLVAAMIASRLRISRILVALAGAAGLTHALVWSGNVVTAGWMAILLLVCLSQISRGALGRGPARFAPEERPILDHLVAGVAAGRARHLIDQGMWLTGEEGDVLTREGEPARHLYFLAEGEARVLSSGRLVGRCTPGDLVGELTALSGEPASATVILEGPARFWCAPAAALKPYVEANEDIRHAVEHGINEALKAKLRASNRMIAAAKEGSAPAPRTP